MNGSGLEFRSEQNIFPTSRAVHTGFRSTHLSVQWVQEYFTAVRTAGA